MGDGSASPTSYLCILRLDFDLNCIVELTTGFHSGERACPPRSGRPQWDHASIHVPQWVEPQ